MAEKPRNEWEYQQKSLHCAASRSFLVFHHSSITRQFIHIYSFIIRSINHLQEATMGKAKTFVFSGARSSTLIGVGCLALIFLQHICFIFDEIENIGGCFSVTEYIGISNIDHKLIQWSWSRNSRNKIAANLNRDHFFL